MRLRLNDYPLWKNSTLNTCGSQLDDREHVQFIICLLGAILCCKVLSVYHFLECYDFFIKISQLRSLSIWLCSLHVAVHPKSCYKRQIHFYLLYSTFPCIYNILVFVFITCRNLLVFCFFLPIVLLYMGYVFYNFVVDFRGRV